MDVASPGRRKSQQDASELVPWRDRPNVTIQVAAAVIGISAGKVYDLAGRGDLDLVLLAGRTLVTVPSLVRFIAGAVPYDPDKSRANGAARKRMGGAQDRPTPPRSAVRPA